MRKSREKENKSLLRVQDYTNDKRKLKTKAIPDYFPWPTAFMLTGPKKGLSFQANTPSPLPPPPTLACNVLHGNVLQLQGEAKGYHMERNIEKKQNKQTKDTNNYSKLSIPWIWECSSQ